MRLLISIRLRLISVPLVIQIDHCLSTSLPPVSKTDSSRGVCCRTWIRPLISIELDLLSVPLVIQIDPCLSTTLPLVSKTDSSRGVFYLTWMRPLTIIHTSPKHLMLFHMLILELPSHGSPQLNS